MARRYDHTKDEIIEMGITAGQNLITEEGYVKMSARKVAKDISYTVGTIYNVFGSHDELILHINARTLDDMYEFISNKMDKNLAGSEGIKELAKLYLQFASQNYNRWSALFEFNLPQNTPLPDWYEDKIKNLFALVEVSLNGNSKLPEHAAKVLWASIHGICQLGLTGKLEAVKAKSIESLTNSLIDNYMRGLK